MIEINFYRALTKDATGKVIIFDGEQFAVDQFKGELIFPETVAAKEGGRCRVQVEIGNEIENAPIVNLFVAQAVQDQVVATAVVGHVHRPLGAMNFATPDALAMSGVILNVLTDRAAGKVDCGKAGVFRRRFKVRWHGALELGIDWVGGRLRFLAGAGGVVTHLLKETSLGVDTLDLAHEIFHNVSKVDADIQQHAALILLVTPDRDEHLVALRADRGVDHKARLTNNATVDECFGQAVNWVAAVVFGHAHHQLFISGSLAHDIAGAHRQADRFFDHGVKAVVDRLHRQRMVKAGCGGNIDCLHPQRGQIIHLADNGGPLAKVFGGLIGQRFGIFQHRVAGADQVKLVEAGAMQFGQAIHVAVAHAAAANNG